MKWFLNSILIGLIILSIACIILSFQVPNVIPDINQDYHIFVKEVSVDRLSSKQEKIYFDNCLKRDSSLLHSFSGNSNYTRCIEKKMDDNERESYHQKDRKSDSMIATDSKINYQSSSLLSPFQSINLVNNEKLPQSRIVNNTLSPVNERQKKRKHSIVNTEDDQDVLIQNLVELTDEENLQELEKEVNNTKEVKYDLDNDILPLTMETEPYSIVINSTLCILPLSNLTLKYQGVSMMNYSFETDEQCNERNKQIDRNLYMKEEKTKESKDYEEMMRINEMDTSALYASDHISKQHIIFHYSLIMKQEKQIFEIIKKRMKEESCFSSIVHKYSEMTNELSLTRVGLWRSIKTALLRQRQTTQDPVSSDMVYDSYRLHIVEKRKLHRNEFHNVFYFSEKNDYCDGCPVPEGTKSFESIFHYPEHYLIRKFIGDHEVTTISTVENPWYPDSSSPFDVTAIGVVFSYNRLFSLRHFLYRYHGPLSLVIHIQQQHEPYVIRYINQHHFPSRVTILLYLVDKEHPFYSVFPINELRNLAIRNIRTTHFLILDMDLRVTKNTYEELHKLPSFLYKSNTSAVILPVFFYNHTRIIKHCDSIENCAYLVNSFQPENKIELLACVASGNCLANKRRMRTHMYIMPEWYIASSSSHVSRVRCFITDFMEPYIMVKYTPNTPLFYPHFINYGYNKVQYFEHLRQASYSFYILNHAFAMDFPHPDSSFRSTYTTSVANNKKMKEMYNQLQIGFNQIYQNVTNFPICYNKQPAYYEEIFSL